ncbi:prolyl 4-hydroxylase subunit alpha [Bacillus pseudomycoides]|uniref:Prolyl 4-hydroxylase subunit alpha n=1 Tax=Bacillus pseudomycoides TaxID=64104 RepID=A0ABD6T0A2_9BACI|nr:2OG-Fe(II) oxygenase [Bacillus pseudomycoides]MBD5798462.1 prolyl 4-hydroxylase subunit alpha [Bacillus pseudomycoides]MED1474497.1 2OG-Fe(II) oxygenase [Bacillus pseudomycoides]MED4650924.1 2OG-Fe(II) oxygenase [Bacillus pseudomycoides]PEE03036.1 prolyl 4-hydroxylase subunit alpha [Bacillus pseudomycoides]PEM74729.1 prolyl 4-hydroxylase subunit alpha [Bacillus pseudomycoides]
MSKLLTDRIFSLDWNSLQQMLDEQGYAAIPALLDVKQCNEIIDTYEEKGLFRSTVNMARYRFGVGEYKYYQAPLPDLLQQLREGLYPELAKTANRWLEQLNRSPEYPETLEMFLDQCHQAGQNRPTPLILKYEAGGYNCLHQDLYGDISFPFQVVFTLNQRNEDYTGGEFLLIEQRPRAQSRGHVITLNRGEGLIFSTQYRPVLGTRGYYRVALRHGVSTVSSGMRYSLGVIFHDAK